jgi:hypothetical protein
MNLSMFELVFQNNQDVDMWKASVLKFTDVNTLMNVDVGLLNCNAV